MHRALLTIALAVLVPTALAPRARAQDAAVDVVAAETQTDAEAEAQALFRRGVELGEQDRWAEALENFRRSRELAERPNTVFNIGFALSRLGGFRQAIEAFDRYLALTEDQPSERREEAIRLRGRASASLGEISVHVGPPDARVLVDGEPTMQRSGSPRVLRLDPGRHVMRASADGHEEGVLTISVLAGEVGERSIVLARRGETSHPREHGSVLEDPIFWVVAGVIVAAGVGIGIGVAVSSEGAPPDGGSTGVVLDSLRF